MSIVSLLSDCPSYVFSWWKVCHVTADIFANSLAMMPCGGSSEVSAVSLILLFTLVHWTLTCKGGWVCSFNCSIMLSPKSSLIFALHWPFLRNSHSYERTSFARSFWKTYINPFLIIFGFLFCEDTNSIILTKCLFKYVLFWLRSRSKYLLCCTGVIIMI